MAATVLTGTGPISYTNSTGGNVRVIVMSCRTSGVTNKTGTITCGTATYPIHGNIKWGKGIPVLAGTATTSLQKAAEMPHEFMLASGDVFSLANTPTESVTGQVVYDNTLTNGDLTGNWTAPANVNSVCVVCVGSGAYMGSGGSLAWKNDIPVTPGQSYAYQVGRMGSSSTGYNHGGDTWFINNITVYAPGGAYQTGTDTGWIGDGGGTGQKGAGGYTGDGGASAASSNSNGKDGKGGGGGGNGSNSSSGSGAGGGVGLLGQGSNGKGGGYNNLADTHGHGGSGGQDGPSGNYGGGGAGDGSDRNPGIAGMRIIWGQGRAYPMTNTADDATGNDTVIESYNILVIPEGN